MSDSSQLEDKKVEKSAAVEESSAPLTKMLDEFLKDRPSGTVGNAKELATKVKEAHDVLNDQMNHRYQRWNGRDALRLIEEPRRIPVETTFDEKQRPVSYSNDKRALDLKYADDGSLEKVTVSVKDGSASPFWTEAELVSFEKNKDGQFHGMMKMKDGNYPSRVANQLRVWPDGSITYFDGVQRENVSINMDNSVGRWGKEDHDWNKEPLKFELTRRDGTKRLTVHSSKGTSLTIEGVPTAIYQDAEQVYGFYGIAPSAAVLDTKEGGKIAFLPNKDGTYTRAAFDPQGNLSADVIFNKPLPHFIHDLTLTPNLNVQWAPFDKNGVHFTMTGVNYSTTDNFRHYLNYKRDKGR